jgi:hypothetical protein
MERAETLLAAVAAETEDGDGGVVFIIVGRPTLACPKKPLMSPALRMFSSSKRVLLMQCCGRLLAGLAAFLAAANAMVELKWC